MFSMALEKELVSLRDFVSLLLCEKEEKRKRLGCDTTTESGSVEGHRVVWQHDVERSMLRLCPLVDVGRYRTGIHSMTKVMLNGDLAALLETQRTLLS